MPYVQQTGIDLMWFNPSPASCQLQHPILKAELKSWTASRIGELTQVLLKACGLWALKMDGWEATFMLGRPGLFSGAFAVSFSEVSPSKISFTRQRKSQGCTKQSINDDDAKCMREGLPQPYAKV